MLQREVRNVGFKADDKRTTENDGIVHPESSYQQDLQQIADDTDDIFTQAGSGKAEKLTIENTSEDFLDEI